MVFSVGFCVNIFVDMCPNRQIKNKYQNIQQYSDFMNS